MTYFLDTNAVVAVLRNRPTTVRDRLDAVLVEGGAVALSSVALFELWYGVARSQHRRNNVEKLKIFLAGNVAIIPFEEEDAVQAGKLRADLERAGTSIGPFDLLIAAQALRTGFTLVTANVSEFARVPGLRWRDWTAA